MEKKTITLYVRHFPRDVHAEAVRLSTLAGMPHGEWVIELVRREVEKEKNKKK